MIKKKIIIDAANFLAMTYFIIILKKDFLGFDFLETNKGTKTDPNTIKNIMP